MRPLLSFFAAQEIPAALVTFVSLLMFIQLGIPPALSTCYSALLALPWVLKPLMGRIVRRQYLYRTLLISECMGMLLLLLMSMLLSPNSPLFGWFGMASSRGVVLFFTLLLLGIVTSWHIVLADKYYHVMVRARRLRLYYSTPRMVISQAMIVVTYGLLIILVGSLQVLTHSIYESWATVCKLLLGIMVLFFLWHLLPLLMYHTLKLRPQHYNRPQLNRYILLPASWSRRRTRVVNVLLLLLLLLPQSLMFYSRVLFLLAPVAEGGLSRSIQEVGFAHGVVGALAFFIGLALSRWRRDWRRLFVVVLLSPLLYLYMAYNPPTMLWQLCVCTFIAQLFFGFGLHSTLARMGLLAMSGLRLPLVALVMLPFVAVSGWMLDVMHFQQFFLLDVLLAVPAIILLIIRYLKKRFT